MRWFLRPDRWPRTPEQWLDAAAQFPITPSQWLEAAAELRRSPTRMFLDLIHSVAESLKGRELEIRSGQSDVVLVLDEVRTAHEPSALGPVRPNLDVEVIDELDIDTRDLRWEAGRLDRLRIALRNVHLEPGVPAATAVAEPIELTAELGQETFAWWLARETEDIEIVLDGDGTATVRPVQWRRWVAATVRPRLDGRQIHVDVMRVKVGPFTFRRVPRVPERHTIELPEFDRDLRITGVQLVHGAVRVRAHIPVWREPLHVDQVLRAAGTAGRHVVFSRAG